MYKQRGRLFFVALLKTGVVFSWYIEEPILCSAARSIETGDSLGIKSTEERRLRALRHEHNASVTDVVSARISQMAPDEGK